MNMKKGPIGAPPSDTAKAVETAMLQIEKQFGKGYIMKLGDQSAQIPVNIISSGSIGLDAAMGVGGYPRGRIIEVYGKESSGKTTLTLHAIAECQRAGGVAAFIDAEHALDARYARNLGVDIDNLLISQPDYGEQALEIAEVLTRSNAIDLIVIDSVAALTPRAEIEGEMGDSHMGLQARLMSQALRKLTAAVSKSHTMIMFTNQVRMKLGVMFGNPETTTGGNALKFYASMRLEVRRVSSITIGEEVVGSQTRVKVVKNKLAAPFREAEFDITYGNGISRQGELIDLGSQLEVLKKSGTWFSFGDTRLGQGKENCKAFLKDNPAIAEEVERQIRTRLEIPRPGPVEAAE